MSAENSISEDDRYLEYPAFDGQVRFSVTFKFQRDEDLEVAMVNQDGTPSILRLNVDYTVSGAGEDLGGAITLAEGAKKDVVYSIRGDAEYNLYQRLTSANYSPSTINAIFERCLIWIIEQDHNFREKLARSILLPQSLSEAELQELQDNFITIGNNAEAIVSRIHERYLTESSDGHFDAAGRSIRNLPEPTQEDEAATLGWVLKRSAIAGPQGEKGPDGDQGPEGPTGPVGPQGPIGPKGPEGDQGEQGPIGIQGPQGKRGPIGPEGPAGEQGPQGMVGPQGPTGPRGPEGVQGPIGIQGPQGPQGAEGPMGESYEVDSMGLIANRAEYDTKPYMWSFLAIDEGKIYWKRSNEIAHWTDGIAFGRGPTGSQGPQGPQGVKGEKGDLGPQGEAGPQGPQGIEGPTGETGPRGPEGPEGPIGPQGVVGAQGAQGIQGVKGETGLQGPIGPSGPTGPQGPKGDRGATWRGSWSAAMAYVVNDLVEYDGSTYIALASSSNVAPTGSLGTKWSLFAEAGSASNHTHDDRYYTKSISNGRYYTKDASDMRFVSRQGDNLSGPLFAEGELGVSPGTGGVSLTTNDGQGNANVTFNHANGITDQAGNAARITVNVDATTNANMDFQLKSDVGAMTNPTLKSVLTLFEDRAEIGGKEVYHTGNAGGLGPSLAILEDQKPSGTSGQAGQFEWYTKDLNSEVSDPSNIVTLSGNQFTVARDCVAIVTVPTRDNTFLRLWNVTNSQATTGITRSYAAGGYTFSHTFYAHLSAGKTYKVQQKDGNVSPNIAASGEGTEVYTRILLIG